MLRTCLPLAVAALCAAAVPASADTVAPTADASVSAAHPAKNYGARQRLVVKRRPATRAFLRFDGVAPARRAVLRVYAVRGSRSGVTVRRAAGRALAERAATYRRAPRATGPSIRSGALRTGQWAAIDVTRLVAGRTGVVLALSSRGSATLASREAGALAPRLVLDGDAAAPGAAPFAAPAAGAPPAPPAPPRAAGETPWPGKPCGVTTTAPAWEHIVWIVMENHSFSQTVGSSSTPYTNSLAEKCGVATNFSAEARPSLPNYIAMTSGSTQGVADNDPPSAHALDVPNIFAQLGDDWRSLQDGMTTNCQLESSGDYAVKHNPAAYYTNVREACNRLDVPMTSEPDVSARFTFITPSMCNSTHDCGLGVGDKWLQTTITKILDSQAYRAGKTALFLTWDEGEGDQHIATLVVSPSTQPGTKVATAHNHYSLLRTTEEMLGLGLIGEAATAPSMRTAFGL
jgi:hypothetical protein